MSVEIKGGENMEEIVKQETQKESTSNVVDLQEIAKSVERSYEKLAEALGANAKEVKQAVDLKMSEIEKAVSTMFDGYKTQQPVEAVQDVPASKVFYSAGLILDPMPSTAVPVPVLGMAEVTGEGTATDSEISSYMDLTVKQFTAKYPISYYLETAGGGKLLTAIEQNLKQSIARKFDVVATTKTTGFFNTALGEARDIAGNWSDAATLYEQILTEAALAELDISAPSEWNLYLSPIAFARLAKDGNLLTVDKIGDQAILVSGQIATLFGMRVFVVPCAGNHVFAVNRKFVATGSYQDWNYERGLDTHGNTMIFGRKLLGFTVDTSKVLDIVTVSG